jgi:hypothetical protein
MKALYKFFRHRNRISAFAQVGVECTLSSMFSVKWAANVAIYEQRYANAVLDGVSRALHWHCALGGSSAEFTIVGLVELQVDTKEDAVMCTATMAAWLALGHSETELVFEFDWEWHAGI